MKRRVPWGQQSNTLGLTTELKDVLFPYLPNKVGGSESVSYIFASKMRKGWDKDT